MAKASIHPNYQLATITCACGAVYETASTRGSFAVEICARCHPFYTGRQKLVDSAGRIERFQRRYQLRPGAAATAQASGGPANTNTNPATNKAGGNAGAAGAEDKPAKPPKAEAKPKGEDKGGKPKGEDKGGKPKGEDKGGKPKGEGKSPAA